MYKKSIALFMCLCLLCLCISSCQSGNYATAQEAVANKDYETAIDMFVSLGDYKDSREQGIAAILAYTAEMAEIGQYARAIAFLQQYASFADFSKTIAEFEEEKAHYSTYLRAFSHFKTGEAEAGFVLLDTLPDGYRNKETIYTSYRILQQSPFIGIFRDDSMGEGKPFQEVTFSLMFSDSREQFIIRAYKAVYWSDGSIYKDYYLYVTVDDIENGVARAEKFVWVMNGDGTLRETENQNTPNLYYPKQA